MAKKKQEKVFAVFRGKAYWFNNLLNKNKYSDKYELVLGNLDKENTKKAEDLGLYVRKNTKGKEEQGNWIKFKSGFPPRSFIDRNKKKLTDFQIEELRVGNGSEVAVRVNIWTYDPNENMEGATGVAGSVVKVQLIDVVEFNDDDEDFYDYEDSEENEGEEVPDADDVADDLDDDIPF